MKNDNDLFYTCSLIENIGRERKLKRSDVVRSLGKEEISRIYEYADVFHCEPIAKVTADFVKECSIGEGDFDNVASCKYEVPSRFDIGNVYSRLIEDVVGDNNDEVVDKLIEVYTSWIDDAISNYNTDFYYQSREYIFLCYQDGEICA